MKIILYKDRKSLEVIDHKVKRMVKDGEVWQGVQPTKLKNFKPFNRDCALLSVPSRYPFFAFSYTIGLSLDILPNFNLLRTLQRADFGLLSPRI